MALRIDLLQTQGCAGAADLLPVLNRLSQEFGAELDVHTIDDEEAARAAAFAGSPTVRVNGQDVDPAAADLRLTGVSCRVYRVGAEVRQAPPEEWMRAALERAAAQTHR
jgi:hypothetical protein